MAVDNRNVVIVFTLQEVTEEVRAGLVLLTGRIDGGNPHEIGRELDDLIRGAIHGRSDPIVKFVPHDALL